MKFAAFPSCESAFEALNWFFAITPIGLAKLVTNAIMKKSANIVAMANTLPPCFSCVLMLFYSLSFWTYWFIFEVYPFFARKSIADMPPEGRRGRPSEARWFAR